MSDTEARDVLAEAIKRYRESRHPNTETVQQFAAAMLYRGDADAGLAALRERGFAVVRAADVEAARDCARGMALECRGKPKDDYNALADRLEEAIR